MGITSKTTEFYGRVGREVYLTNVESRGRKNELLEAGPNIEKRTMETELRNARGVEQMGMFEFSVYRKTSDRNKQADLLLHRYAQIAPLSGNLGDSDMKVMLETPSIVTSEYAISYGFADAGTGRAHQCYAYITASQERWMDLLRYQQPKTRDVPFNAFVLAGAHDAGMYRLGLDPLVILSRLTDDDTLKILLASSDKRVADFARGLAKLKQSDKVSPPSRVQIQRIMSNFALTQKDSTKVQLQLGTRYFDFRPGHHVWDPQSELHHQHAVIPGCSLATFLAEVNDFLRAHPGEIVVTSFSNSAFADPDRMTPRDGEVARAVAAAFGKEIVVGNDADLKKTYGTLILENRRFIALKHGDLKSTYNENANKAVEPDGIVKYLNALEINQNKGYVVQLQGTASDASFLDKVRTPLTFSDASSPLLYTKARFDYVLYPWVKANYKRFSGKNLLVLLNDFSDGNLAEISAQLSRERTKWSEEYKPSEYGTVQLDWLNILGDRAYKTRDKTIPFSFDVNNIQRLKTGPFERFRKTVPYPGYGNTSAKTDLTSLFVINETSSAKQIRVNNGDGDILKEVGPNASELITMSLRSSGIYILHDLDGTHAYRNVQQRKIMLKELYGSPEANADWSRGATLLAIPSCDEKKIEAKYAEVLNTSLWWFDVDCESASSPSGAKLPPKDYFLADFSISGININGLGIDEGYNECSIYAGVELKLKLKPTQLDRGNGVPSR